MAGGMRVSAARKRPGGPSKEKLKLYKQDEKEKKEKQKKLEKNANHKVGMTGVTRRIILAVSGIVLLAVALFIALKYFSHLLPSPQQLADGIISLADAYGAAAGTVLAVGLAGFFGTKHILKMREEARKREEAQTNQRIAREEAEKTKARRKDAAKAALELRLKSSEMSLKERAEWLEEWERKDALRQEEEDRMAAERRAKELAELEIQQQLQRNNRMISSTQGGNGDLGMGEVDFGEGDYNFSYNNGEDGEEEGEDGEDGAEGEEEDRSSGSEEEEEEEQEQEEQRELLDLELAPAKRGTQIGMEPILWSNIGTARPHLVRLQAACAKCGTKQDMELSGMYSDAHEKRARCTKCSQTVGLSLRPCIAHDRSPVLAFVDRENAVVADVLSVQLLASCLDCSEDCLLPPSVRGARADANCQQCHKKLAATIKSFPLVVYEATDGKGVSLDRQASSASGKGGSKRPAIVGLTEGTPLPDYGACEHFKKSLRWLRFGCCGRAYPCVICHEKSDCPEADMGVRATRMICGACSREQNYSSGPCVHCGFSMDKSKASAHWEGGGGSRNTANLSDKDRRKNKGVSREGTRKTASKKAQRVGQQGKKAREAKQGGKD